METISEWLNALLELFFDLEFMNTLFIGASPVWVKILYSLAVRHFEMSMIENDKIDEFILKSKCQIGNLLSKWRLRMYDELCEILDGEEVSDKEVKIRFGSGITTYPVSTLLEKSDRKFDDMITEELIKKIFQEYDKTAYWNIDSEEEFEKHLNEFVADLRDDMEVFMYKKVGRSRDMYRALDTGVSHGIIFKGLLNLYLSFNVDRANMVESIKQIKKIIKDKNKTFSDKVSYRTKSYLQSELWKLEK